MVELLLLAAIGVFFTVPGILLSFALLHKESLSRAEKILVGVMLGLFLPPFLETAEFILFNAQFNSGLVLLNTAVVWLAAMALLWRQGQLKSLPSSVKEAGKAWKDYKLEPASKAVFVAVLALMAFAFWLRFHASWAANFFEFDPYYYDFNTQMLVKNGSVPAFSDVSYYPNPKSHREFPGLHYLTGGWYSLYKDFKGGGFSQEDMILTIQLYPPLVGALLAFIVFIYLKEEYDKYVALVGAALMALMPQLVTKFAAGVSELAPLGIFAAVMALAFFGLAVKRGGWKLALLTGFASAFAIVSSAHHVWPFSVVAAYVGVQAAADFLSGRQDAGRLYAPVAFAAGAVMGNFLLSSYKLVPLGGDTLAFGTVLLVLVTGFSALLWLLQKYDVAEKYKLGKAKLLALVLVAGIVVLAVSPYGGKVFEYINGSILTASGSNALYKTVQEGAATNPGYFPSAFGPINPNTILVLATAMAIMSAFVAIWRRKSHVYALAFGAAAAAVVFFNYYVDAVLKIIADATAQSAPQFSLLLNFVITSDVFIYMIVSMLSAFLAYVYSEEKDALALLTVLIVFPASYAGLSRVKYLLYVGLALAFATAFVLGEFGKAVRTLNAMFNAASERTMALGIAAIVLLAGAWSVSAVYGVANAASDGLQYSRITPDWLESFAWMRGNLGPQDRVIAWWDYGHWIVFFGGSKAVIDPGNVYPEFDQEVAHAFVNGNTSELIQTMRDHGATYALMDAELYPKWGALNYLSSTYNGSKNNYQPANRNWQAGPGQSDYEAEHSFEQIYSVFKQEQQGQATRATCPGLVPRTMLYSSFGALYCMDSAGGISVLLADAQKPVSNPSLIRAGDDSSLSLQPLGNTGLFFNTNPAFINVNPDLETLTNGRLESKLFAAAFVQLFFFEKLAGFELAYKSPGGQVKIFKLVATSATDIPATSLPTATPSPTTTPVPAPTSTPTLEPTSTPTPQPTPANQSDLPFQSIPAG